jgi:DNA-binding winged helix-turn-helix (wHTH) protein
VAGAGEPDGLSIGAGAVPNDDMPVYEFGEFVFDTSSGEIRRGSDRVRLRPQPSMVLEYLVQHPGKVIAREELRRVVWPDGIFVHFDHGLNSCIKQVRAALSDRRKAPRYLETIPRRGYRFIGAVSDGRPSPLAPRLRRGVRRSRG